MNKDDIINQVSESTGQSRHATREVLDTFLEVVSEKLSEGCNVEIRGFGSFKVRSRRERAGRNPRTGEKVAIPRRSVPTFKSSQRLNEKLAKVD